MEASHAPGKRPQSKVKPSSHRAPPRGHHRRRRTGTTKCHDDTAEIHSDPSVEFNALAEFKFFEDDDTTTGMTGLPSTTNNNLRPVQAEQETVSDTDPDAHANFGSCIERGFTADAPDTPPPLFPQYTDTSEMRLEKLTHPSGSPVLGREYMLNVEYSGSFISIQELEDDFQALAKHFKREEDAAELGSDNDFFSKMTELPDIRDSVLAVQEEPAVSIAKQVAGPGHVESEILKPKIVDISMDYTKPRNPLQGHLNEQSLGRQKAQRMQQASSGTQDFRTRTKSLPVPAEFEPGPPATTLESTREWRNDLADKEAETWSNDLVVDSINDRGEESSLTAKRKFQPRSASLGSKPSTSKASSGQLDMKRPAPARILKGVRPATPGPATRPASPPLHRNAADTRKPLEKQNRDSWTLYNLSCRTDKAVLKSLLSGPIFEFRAEPHGEPFLENVSQEMLKHFCGKDHLARLVRDYSLRPEQRSEEDVEKNVLVFPKTLVDPTAIMRVVRYMRRCCMRTMTLTKPHFQLHAPASLEANLEVIRACNIFGLYADARRIQYFLTDKKIPGGKLTMDDVEMIWEGYDGELRDSEYTDALLTHIVYNVLGSDSVDREDVMVLLEQEEFAGLRELVASELGIKKRAAEDKEMFQMRKQLEREEIVNRKNGRGKRLSAIEKLRASRGPMVQGRLLRVLSYDALLEPDLTAETRYKARPGLGRRLTSTPNVLEEAGEEEGLVSAGMLYQNVLKEIKESGSPAKSYGTMRDTPPQMEKEIPLPPREKLHVRPAAGTPAVQTPTGRKYEVDRPIGLQHQALRDIRPPVLPKHYRPVPREEKRMGIPIAGESSDQGAVKGHLDTIDNWREIDQQRASSPYYMDEEIDHLLRHPRSQIPSHDVEEGGLRIL